MCAVCELRASGFFTDFPFQFPGLGRATVGHSETCPEATCFGCVLWVTAMLKGELLSVWEILILYSGAGFLFHGPFIYSLVVSLIVTSFLIFDTEMQHNSMLRYGDSISQVMNGTWYSGQEADVFSDDIR